MVSLLVFLVGGSIALAQSPSPPDFDIHLVPYSLNTVEMTFPTGLRIIVQRDPAAPVVAVSTIHDAGSVNDPANAPGTARMAEYLWFQSRLDDKVRVQDTLYALGAQHQADTHPDHMAFLTLAPSDALPRLLELENARLSQGIENVPNGVYVAIRELVRVRNLLIGTDAFGQAVPHLYQHVFPADHVYGTIRPVGDGLDGITLQGVSEWADQRWNASGTTLMIAGDIDLTETTNAIFGAFDPVHFHPDATIENRLTYRRDGVDNPREGVYEDWTFAVSDPANPDAFVTTEAETTPRASHEAPEVAVPPSAGADAIEVDGLVEERTAVIAWPLPGAYRQNLRLYQVTAGLLELLAQGALGNDPSIAKDPIFSAPKIACRPIMAVEGSMLVCAIGLKGNRTSVESVAGRVMDQISLLWNPDYRTALLDPILHRGQRQGLKTILHGIDDLATPEVGRASLTSRYAHFTDRITVQSDMIATVFDTTAEEMSELAAGYLDRKNAVILEVNPIANDLGLTAVLGAGHYPGDIPNPHFRMEGEDIDIESVFRPPDLSDLKEVTLDNGLRVVVNPYGNAPTVVLSMLWGGGKASGDQRMERYTDHFQRRLPHPMLRNPKGLTLDIGGWWTYQAAVPAVSTQENLKISAGNLDGGMWLMRDLVEGRMSSNEGKARWMTIERNKLLASLYDRNHWSNQLQWDHMAPGHPLPWTPDFEDLDFFKDQGPSSVRAYQAQKFVPQNATLVVTGMIKSAEAIQLARKYLEPWKPSGEPMPPMIEPPPPPSETAVILLDDPGSDKATLDLGCRMADWTPDTWAAPNLAGALIDEELSTHLMGDGVTVYAGYATAQQYDRGLVLLQLFAYVDAAHTAKALARLLSTIEEASEGAFDAGRLDVQRLHLARKFPLQFQSLEQMQSGLVAVLTDPERDLDWYAGLGAQFAGIGVDDLQRAMGTCQAGSIVTIHGPVEKMSLLLDEAGVSYEVFDWKSEADRVLAIGDPKEAKRRAKQP